MKRFAFVSVAAIALAGGACASGPHSIADQELSPEWNGPAYTDVLVIGVYEDRVYRVSSESSFTEGLKSQGINATAGFDLLPDLSSLTSNEGVIEKLAGTGHDAVLIVATLEEGYDYQVEDYFATRGIVYLLGGEPGAGTDMGSFIAWAGSGQYSLYVGLWDAATAKEVWQITTNSTTTGSESEDSRALADLVAETLKANGLL